MFIIKQKPKDINFTPFEPKEPCGSRWVRDFTANEYTCSCCTTRRKQSDFPPVPAPFNSFKDIIGNLRSTVCYDCWEYKFNQLVETDEGHNKYYALYHICALTGIYYSHKVATRMFTEPWYYTDATPVPPGVVTVLEAYTRYISEEENLRGLEFWENHNVPFDAILEYQGKNGDVVLSEEDKRNRLQILSTFHRDIFANEPIAEQKILMANLVTMIDDSMADDYVRQAAAVEIVRTFRRIDKLSDTLQSLQITPEATAENSKTIKELIDQKKKETDIKFNLHPNLKIVSLHSNVL